MFLADVLFDGFGGFLVFLHIKHPVLRLLRCLETKVTSAPSAEQRWSDLLAWESSHGGLQGSGCRRPKEDASDSKMHISEDQAQDFIIPLILYCIFYDLTDGHWAPPVTIMELLFWDCTFMRRFWWFILFSALSFVAPIRSFYDPAGWKDTRIYYLLVGLFGHTFFLLSQALFDERTTKS